MLRRLLPPVLSLLCAAATTCAQAHMSSDEVRSSRVDLYAGYSWMHPVNSGIGGYPWEDSNNPAATGSMSVWFNRYMGMQLEGGYFNGMNQHKQFFPTCAKTECDQVNYTAEGGLVFRYPVGHFVPFLHTLVGGDRYNGPVQNPLKWGWGVTGGIGVDYVLPWWGEHFAVRPVQADWQYSQVVYGPLVLPAGTVGGFGELSAVKLSGGLVLRLGDVYSKPEQLALGCQASATAIFAGDPLVVTSSTIGLDMHRDANFTWDSNGGLLHPDGAQVTVDTRGMQPGQYTVVGHVYQGSRARRQAACEAVFTVREVLPPMVRCSASPVTVRAGMPVTISAIGTSPENRPLTYSYGASEGEIDGGGTLAMLNTTGAQPGSTINVTCNAVDDLGQRATANAQVFVESVATPVAPMQVESTTQTLCTLSFARDRRRPTRVDNEAKACLDGIALAMGRQVDAQLMMVGNAEPGEGSRTAAERADNARQYLVHDRGVDPARVTVRVGQDGSRTVTNTLVPAGETYENPAATVYVPSTPTRARRTTRGMTGTSAPPADTTLPPVTNGGSTTIPPLQ